MEISRESLMLVPTWLPRARDQNIQLRMSKRTTGTGRSTEAQWIEHWNEQFEENLHLDASDPSEEEDDGFFADECCDDDGGGRDFAAVLDGGPCL